VLDGARICAVHHDAGLNGATLLFQSVLEGLVRDYGAVVSSRFPREGPIVPRAREIGPVYVADPPDSRRPREFLGRVARGLRNRLLREPQVPCDLFFANSAASLATVERMRVPVGTPLAIYVHESHYMLRQVCDLAVARRMLGRASLIFAVSAAVQKTIEDLVHPSARIAIVSGFVPVRPGGGESAELSPEVRSAVSSGGRIIGGVGTMSWWKGTDLFVVVARRIRQLAPQQQLSFVWVGEEWSPGGRRQLEHDIKRGELEGVVILPGRMKDPTPFFESLSVFLLPSREDSWPLVMLEAAKAGVPTVCFQKSGGAEEFLASGGGVAVPYLDVEAMAEAAARYLKDPDVLARDSHAAREIGRSVTAGEQVRKIASELSALLAPRSAR
jgi:glycosyltransferase involved in cell wall biosynthesis